jgi:hypothetical protein
MYNLGLNARFVKNRISWKGQGKGMGFKTGERYTRASTTNRAI